MRSTWRLLTFFVLGLLVTGLAGCAASPTPSAKPAQKPRAPAASPQTAASPAVANAGPGTVAPGAAGPSPAGPALAAPSLKLPSDGLQVVLVDATDGEGLWLRRQPSGEPIRVWPEGSPMLIVGEDRYVDGRNWRNVQTLDGQTGWAAADFLFPTNPAALALAASSLSEIAGGPRDDAPRPSGTQARLATAQSTPAARNAPPAAAVPPQMVAREPIAANAAPPSAPQPSSVPPPAAQPAIAAAAATATPGPTATSVPTATPIRAPAGARSIAVGQTTMAVTSSQRGLPIQVGNRPRAGMELVSVTVKVTNRDSAPFALYRGGFRLALSDRTRAEPLAGGESPMPYSATIEPGGELEGTLTFEVPVGTRVDGLVWAPERDVAYSLAIPGS